jgi:hypothetical protein
MFTAVDGLAWPPRSAPAPGIFDSLPVAIGIRLDLFQFIHDGA